MRTLASLAFVSLAALTLSVAPARSQTTAQPCGVETWSTDKMAYVSVPCTEGQEQTNQAAKKPDAPATTAKCGVETWSTDKMAYESTPCAPGTSSGAK